jgi:hypothetical protein
MDATTSLGTGHRGDLMTTTASPRRSADSLASPHGLRRLWDRQLRHYPDNGPRAFYLGLTVIVTVTLYYEFYVQGSVATRIIRDHSFTFTQYVYVQVIGAAVGAGASIFAGLADRWGRAHLVMVSLRDRALIEARAAGLDVEQALEGHWRKMLRIDIVGSAFGIAIYLLVYYSLVVFNVVYLATVYGYSEARANALGNWAWIAFAVALIVVGALSD